MADRSPAEHMWTCPDCGRPFGRRNQGHTCSRGMTIEEFFADSRPWERQIYDEVIAHLEQLGPVTVDPVQVGVFFKNGPIFAELRPMKKWMALTFMLPVKLENPRLSRKVIPAGSAGSKFYHVVNVASVGEIDGVIRDWLTEAYFSAD